MDKKEALKRLDGWVSVGAFECWDVAKDALRREVEREEAEKWRVCATCGLKIDTCHGGEEIPWVCTSPGVYHHPRCLLEPKRPTIEEQERAVSLADCVFHAELPDNELHCCKALNAARDTLRTLREEVVPWILRAHSDGNPGYVIHHGNSQTYVDAPYLLRKLGLSP